MRFRPGMIIGGVFTFDCGVGRCLSYFLEPLMMMAPFCKNPITAKLKGLSKVLFYIIFCNCNLLFQV